MKRIFLLTLFFSIHLISQEFTPPDSAAIINSHVKSVKIFYSGTGTTHYFTKEYRYNKNGQCIYENSGNAYYYSFEYNEAGELAVQTQRGMNGEFMSRCKMDYYPDKNKFHSKVYVHSDTINPENVYTYNEKGNVLSEINYYKGKIRSANFYTYNLSGELIGSKDSIPFDRVIIRSKKNLDEVKQYDSLGKWKETWKFKYDENGKLLSATQEHLMDMDNIYTFLYDQFGKVSSIQYNHFPASSDKKNAFKKQWGYLLPRDEMEDEHFPIADPVAEPQYNHTLKRDANGNILSDEVDRAESYSNKAPVIFTYEYEYW